MFSNNHKVNPTSERFIDNMTSDPPDISDEFPENDEDGGDEMICGAEDLDSEREDDCSNIEKVKDTKAMDKRGSVDAVDMFNGTRNSVCNSMMTRPIIGATDSGLSNNRVDSGLSNHVGASTELTNRLNPINEDLDTEYTTMIKKIRSAGSSVSGARAERWGWKDKHNHHHHQQQRDVDLDTFNEIYSVSKFMMWPAGHTPIRMHSKADLGLETAIWEIIRDDLVTELRYHLKSTPELIQTTDNAGYTPIHVAAKYNRVSSLAVLLDWKADPNVVGPYDMYPLHLAAKYNSIDAASYMLEHGANILCRDCKHKTPLHHAARKGHKQMIEMLLSYRHCNIDVEDEDRLTPLHEACQLKQSKVAEYLIDHGACIDARDISDGTPLLFAAAEGLTDIIEIILNYEWKQKGESGKLAILNHLDNEGMSALHLAVQNNQTHVISLLLDNGADVNIQNHASFTPLHMASINGHTEIVKMLLQRGASVESRDADHMTPVHRCAMYGKQSVLEMLLKKGASINARTSEQMTPLLVAAWKGHLEVVEYLLSHGAKLTTSDSCMRTALHWSVDQGHYNVLHTLIKNGGEDLLSTVDHKDETVAHFAARTGNTMIMKLLIDYSVDLDARNQDGKTPLHIAAECGNYTSVEIQIDSSKSEINDGDSDGRTPLMLACLCGHFKAARSLLALGADNSIRDENYCTALILAASKGHVKVMELLLDNLAEPNVSDKLKNTALHMSAAGGHVEAVRLLLDRNVLPCMKNSYKKTPLDMAMDYEQSDVAVAMLKHKKWKDVMGSRDEFGYSPMKKLVKKAPEAAMVVLDGCVEESDHRKDDMEYSLTFDFHYIDPGPNDQCCSDKRYFALDTMVEFNREDLLSHPLTQSLLIMKWRKFGRYILYSNLFIYTMYVAALNTYMVVIPAMSADIVDNDRRCPIEVEESQKSNQTYINILKEFVGSVLYSNLFICTMYVAALNTYMVVIPAMSANIVDNDRGCPIEVEESQKNNQTYINILKERSTLSHLVVKHGVLLSLQIILQAFIIVLMLKELFLLWGQKWRYFINPFTYWNWIMMISTIVFINPPNRYPCEPQWRGAWVSSICAWILLISYLQRVDIVGIYFVMFSEVMLSLMKVMLVLLVFLMAFSQAFAGVIAKVPGFQDNDFFPLTVLAMTLGELNYVQNFVEQDNFPFAIDANIIMFMFMITMPIALMNLLIGIAVGDIDKIQKGAYIKRIGLQADQTNNSENRLPKTIQKKIYQRHFVIKPHAERNTRWARVRAAFKYHVFGIQTSLDFITQSEQDIQLKTLQELQRNIHRNKQQLSDIQSNMKVQNEVLKNICDHFNIEVKNKMDKIDNVSIYSDRTDLHNVYT